MATQDQKSQQNEGQTKTQQPNRPMQDKKGDMRNEPEINRPQEQGGGFGQGQNQGNRK